MFRHYNFSDTTWADIIQTLDKIRELRKQYHK